jgi:hypothetical protein
MFKSMQRDKALHGFDQRCRVRSAVANTGWNIHLLS